MVSNPTSAAPSNTLPNPGNTLSPATSSDEATDNPGLIAAAAAPTSMVQPLPKNAPA